MSVGIDEFVPINTWSPFYSDMNYESESNEDDKIRCKYDLSIIIDVSVVTMTEAASV